MYHPKSFCNCLSVNAGGEISSRIQGLDSPFTKVKYFVKTQGASVQFNKDYFIAEADAKSDRRLDLEEHKWEKVVMNPKWRDELYMQLCDADEGGAMFNLWYRGDQVWLCGRGSQDVTMEKTRSDSKWFLQEEGRDSFGHQKYSLWTWRTDVMDLNGTWFSENFVSQIGYDKDFELKSYAKGFKPDIRWLYIKILDPKDRNTIWHEGQRFHVHV